VVRRASRGDAGASAKKRNDGTAQKHPAFGGAIKAIELARTML
jgi:hypothetical protein